MDKKIFLIIVGVMLATVAFCGCNEEQAAVKNKRSGTVTLDSSVVELSDSKMDFVSTSEYDSDCDCTIEFLKRVDVSYLFHNIAGKDIAASVTVELYDKDGHILWISPEPKTLNLPEDYTEKGYFGANTVSYDGQRLDDVDHAILVVTDVKE